MADALVPPSVLVHHWDLQCGAQDACVVSDEWKHVTCQRCWASLWVQIERTPEPTGCCGCACWDCPYEEKREMKPGISGEVRGVQENERVGRWEIKVRMFMNEPADHVFACDEEFARKWKIGDQVLFQMMRKPRPKRTPA